MTFSCITIGVGYTRVYIGQVSLYFYYSALVAFTIDGSGCKMKGHDNRFAYGLEECEPNELEARAMLAIALNTNEFVQAMIDAKLTGRSK